MPKKDRTIKCKTCAYIRSHPENSVNADLLKGVPYSTISYKTGLGIFTLKKHFEEKHMMAQFLPRSRAMKVGREQLELLKCQKEVYDLSIKAARIAIGDEPSELVKPDLRSFGSCISGAAKIVEVLAKIAPNDQSETESDGFEEALKAKAKDVWKEARPVQVATTESEAMADDDLVET